jgi:hypothetical protein
MLLLALVNFYVGQRGKGSMRTLFIAMILLISSVNGYTGEYFLTISDDPNSACALKARKSVERGLKDRKVM